MRDKPWCRGEQTDQRCSEDARRQGYGTGTLDHERRIVLALALKPLDGCRHLTQHETLEASSRLALPRTLERVFLAIDSNGADTDDEWRPGSATGPVEPSNADAERVTDGPLSGHVRCDVEPDDAPGGLPVDGSLLAAHRRDARQSHHLLARRPDVDRRHPSHG
jgi:hypothetical protein